MNNKKLMGATLAAAAALAFTMVPVSSFAAKSADKVHCYGANACKGKAACKTAKNACKGQNSCKGQGFVMAKTAKACKKLGGSTEEPSS